MTTEGTAEVLKKALERANAYLRWQKSNSVQDFGRYLITLDGDLQVKTFTYDGPVNDAGWNMTRCEARRAKKKEWAKGRRKAKRDRDRELNRKKINRT